MHKECPLYFLGAVKNECYTVKCNNNKNIKTF